MFMTIGIVVLLFSLYPASYGQDGVTNVQVIDNSTDTNTNTNDTCRTPEKVYQTSGPVNIYLNGGNNNNEGHTGNCKCPAGPQGLQGPQGPRGPQGPPGISPAVAPLTVQQNSTVTPEEIKPYVAFFVKLSLPYGPHPIYKRVIYDTVITNIGSSYNKYRGVFTAPISGVYQFHLHIHTTNKHKAQVQLVVGRQSVVSAWAESEEAAMGHEQHEMGSSNSMILHLHRGQYIYCVLPKNQVLAGMSFTSFSGHLLRTDTEIGYKPPTTPPPQEYIDLLAN